MNNQLDLRLIHLMIDKVDRLMSIHQNHTKEEIESNYILSDAIQFEFEKLYEDSTRLSVEFRMNNPEIHMDDLRSIRNRVAHNYESVSIDILISTIENDLPALRALFVNYLNKINS